MRGPILHVAQDQMRGALEADKYLDELMTKERWVKIYKELTEQDQEYQAAVRDYLNKFDEYNRDSDDEDGECEPLGDHLF